MIKRNNGDEVKNERKNGYVRWPQILAIMGIVFIIIGFVIGNVVSKQDTAIAAVSMRQDKVETAVGRLDKSVATLEECVKWLKKYTGVE